MMKPLVIAHRGDSAYAPENTMRAFELAVSKGADWIETDLQLTADGEIVAFHDDDLGRLTGRSGVLTELRYREIEDLRISSPMQGRAESAAGIFADSSVTVPRLLDILHGVGQQVPFYLELKSDGRGRQSERNLELLDRCLGAVEANSHHALASFDLDLVRGARESGRRAIFIANRVQALEPCSDKELRDFHAVSVAHDCIDEALAMRFGRAGARLWAWTVDARHDIERMLALEVDAICTNDVASTIDLIEECAR